MVQIIPQYNEGTALGTAIGTGLGQNLQRWGEDRRKVAEQAPVFESLGYPRAIAEKMALLDPKMQTELLRNQQGAQFSQSIAQMLGMPYQGTQGLPQQQQQSVQGQYAPQEEMMQQQGTMPQQGMQQGQPGQQQMQQGGQMAFPSNMRPEQAMKYAEMVQNQRRYNQELGLKLNKIKTQEEADHWKTMMPKIDASLNKYKASLRNDARYNTITTLSEKGYGGLNSKLSRVLTQRDIPLTKIPWWPVVSELSPMEEQLLNKTYEDFMKDAAGTLGTNRVLKTQFESLKKAYPNFYNSIEGKLLLVSALKKYGDIDKIEHLEQEKIIEEHNGIPPYNLDQLVEKRTRPKTEKIYKQISDVNYPELAASIEKSKAANSGWYNKFKTGALTLATALSSNKNEKNKGPGFMDVAADIGGKIFGAGSQLPIHPVE
jgi:hypothetical protein